MVEFCELCVIFLSTPSARRATFNKVHKTNLKYISIHALCEEGDAMVPTRDAPPRISIHALCEEGDTRSERGKLEMMNFYPRPLRGGRRVYCDQHCDR